MKSNDLLELIGGIDEEFVLSAQSASGGSRAGWLRWAAAAAAVMIAVCVGVIALNRTNRTPDVPVTPGTVSGSEAISGTSDSYESLDELLEYLSRHDNHSADALSEGGAAKGIDRGSGAEGYYESSSAVVINGYSCHVGEDGVVISRLDEGGAAPVCTIRSAGAQLLAYGNYLIIACQTDTSSPENDLEYKLDLHVSIYDMTDPASPQLAMVISQSGSFCGAFISGETLWLLTSDGECACGYSRLEDKEQYIPAVTVDGKPVELTDEQLHILGQPTMVRYMAISAVSLDRLELADTQTLYGDIDEFYHSEDFLALEICTLEDNHFTQPDVYIFSLEDSVSYTGKISTAAVLGIPRSARASADGAQRFELVSLSRHDDYYRLTGTLYTRGEAMGSSRIAAIQVSSDLADYAVGLSEEYPSIISITETLDEDGRQIICFSTYTEDYRQIGHFGFIMYGETVSILTPEMDIDHMDGIDMIYGMGQPYGEFVTLIPIGGGRYLRYGGSPDRIEAYDLSDPEQPVLLNRHSLKLQDIQRFSYGHFVYGDGRVGFVTLTPGLDDDGEYNYRQRYLSCEYVVCQLAGDDMILSPAAQYKLEGYDNPSLIQWNGILYCVTEGAACPVAVS